MTRLRRQRKRDTGLRPPRYRLSLLLWGISLSALVLAVVVIVTA